MKIVIDIDEKLYERIKYLEPKADTMLDRLMQSVKNGTPLPEHHGRLIDESQIRHIVCHTERELYGDKIRYIKVTDAPTIIEGSDS